MDRKIPSGDLNVTHRLYGYFFVQTTVGRERSIKSLITAIPHHHHKTARNGRINFSCKSFFVNEQKKKNFQTRTTLPHRQSIDVDDDAGRGDAQTCFPFLRIAGAVFADLFDQKKSSSLSSHLDVIHEAHRTTRGDKKMSTAERDCTFKITFFRCVPQCWGARLPEPTKLA